MINIAFSSEFLERFKELNDAKQRVDYETRNLQQKFWIDVTLSYNDFQEEVAIDEEEVERQAGFWEDVRKADFFDVSTSENIQKTTDELVDFLDVFVNLPTNNVRHAVGELLWWHSPEGIELTGKAIVAKFGWRKNTNDELQQQATTKTGEAFDEKLLIVNKYNDSNIQEMVDDGNLDLSDVEVMTSDVYKKRFNVLFRIRQKMKENMTRSGEHNSDPWNFVDVAMNTIPSGRRFPKVGILYFFRRCEEYPEIDAAFQTFLDESMKGLTADNKTDVVSVDNESEGKKRAKTEKVKRIEALASITTIASNTHDMYKEYHQANARKEAIEIVNAEIQGLQVQINVAATLGKTDELHSLSARLSDLLKELKDLKESGKN